MEFGAKARTALLLWRLLEGRENPAVLPMCVQKKPFSFDGDTGSRLPRSSPEAEGVDPAQLERFIERMKKCKEEHLHSMTVLRHGKVIAEHSFLPYDREIWHVTHSLCKTVTALAVGICIGDGLLHVDDRIGDLFPQMHTAAWYRNLTVFHLLTMTSGVSYNEVRSVTERDWIRGYLVSPPLYPVGERFHYNSMNSYMLSAAVCAVTGESLSSFLNRRLFSFMGISRYHWETCPAGIEKGGWGLYLLQEDAAKLGQLILNRGKWNGLQLVPKDYIRDMCFWHSDPPEKLSRNGYGYQCWLWERERSVRMSGLFGQTVLVVPDKDMVLAVNAGSDRMFGESAYLRDFSHLLEHGVFDEDLPGAVQRPLQTVSEETKRHSHSLRVRDGFARRYAVRKSGMRLLPVFMQLSENNYTGGIESVSFLREGARLYMEIIEGPVRNRLEIGFLSPVTGRITANRETYIVACSGRWERKGGVPILSVRLSFLEQACARYFEFSFETADTVRIKLREKPGRQALIDGAALLFDDAYTAARLSEGRIAARLKALCEPECIGVRIKKAAPEFRVPKLAADIRAGADRARPL